MDRARAEQILLRGVVVVALTVVWTGCCLPGGRPSAPPPLPIERARVVEALRRNHPPMIAVVDGSARLRLQHREDDRWRTDITFAGVLAFDRIAPSIYLRAEKLGMALFTLKTHGDRWNLLVPDTKEYVYGTGVSIEKLPMVGWLRELGPCLPDPDALGLDAEHSSFRWTATQYVFDVTRPDYTLLRRVDVDRRDLVITRITEYDPSGRRTLIVRLRQYMRPAEPAGWPGLIAGRLIVEPCDYGVKATVWLDRPKIKPGIPASFFAGHAPPGWRRVNLDVEPLDSVHFIQRARQ